MGVSAVFDMGPFGGFLRLLAGSNTPFKRLTILEKEKGRDF